MCGDGLYGAVCGRAGSLDKRLMQKYGKATPEALVKSRALWACSAWSRELLQINVIEAIAHVLSSTALPSLRVGT